MNITQQEVLRFVEENDVKFIRLAFCDLYGRLKNISVQPGELGRAFDAGIPFDAAAVRGFKDVQGDLYLVPDPGTLSVLPWRPQSGRVIRMFCDLTYPDGGLYESYGRAVLRRAVEKAAAQNITMHIAPKCEFYLFEADGKGFITLTPQDRAGYLDVAPYDKGENVRREICLALEAMHIQPESSHHEKGPGQNEIDFRHADALTAADQLVAFKDVVRSIAAQNGLRASFLPKPLPDENGNGQHVNLFLFKNGENIFSRAGNGLGSDALWAVGGILRRMKECTLFCNPLPNSYLRLGALGAPGFISWSFGSRSNIEMVRELGADRVIDYTQENYTSDARQYDLVFDIAGNHSFAERRRAMKAKGTYVGAGIVALNFSVPGLIVNMVSESVRKRFVSQKFLTFIAKITQEDLTRLADLIRSGKVTPVIDRTYSLTEVPDAIRYLEQRHARGKVLISIG
jgi:glutamine synthetase